MKPSSTLLLRLAVLIIGAAVLTLCVLIFIVSMDPVDSGAYWPILIGLYLPTIPFFYALYQSWKLLNNINKSIAFSESSINALNRIKYCAISITLIFSAGMPYIFIVAQEDDAPGVVLISLIVIFASFIIATFAALLQKLFKEALAIKSENELTV